jgi:hypothetical protein
LPGLEQSPPKVTSFTISWSERLTPVKYSLGKDNEERLKYTEELSTEWMRGLRRSVIETV